MLDSHAIAELRARIPDTTLVDRVVQLDTVAGALPFAQFREPVALMELRDKGSHRILNLDAHYLTGWSRHIAYSMRVRLRALEPGIVYELAAGRALAPQVLLRSHLEASAMAALCLETLKSRDWVVLSRLIPQTLFGTALFNKAKRDERVSEMLSYAEQRTITISQAISALHRFAHPEGGIDDTSVAYSLLCEASHPNHRGTKLFVHAEDVDQTGEHGWHVTYSSDESVPTELTERLVDLLLFSMISGYGATELLRNMLFRDSDDGVVVHGVPEDIGRHIWLNILQRDLDDE